MNTLTYLLEKNPNKDWEWNYISENSNITMKFIEKHPDKQWVWKWISENLNITIRFIEKNIEKIHFKVLSGHKFIYQNKLNKMNKSILALEKAKNRFPKDVNMYIVKHYL